MSGRATDEKPEVFTDPIIYAGGWAPEPLSSPEAARLTELETVVGRGLDTFVGVGTALAEIRDSRLYRQVAGTFEDYCRERWNLSKRYAYDLIGSAETACAIAHTDPDLPPVKNEGQARELAKVEPEKRAEVWSKANQDTGGKPTAAAVKKAAGAKVPAQRKAKPDNEALLTRVRESGGALYQFALGLDSDKDFIEPTILDEIPGLLRVLEATTRKLRAALAEHDDEDDLSAQERAARVRDHEDWEARLASMHSSFATKEKAQIKAALVANYPNEREGAIDRLVTMIAAVHRAMEWDMDDDAFSAAGSYLRHQLFGHPHKLREIAGGGVSE